MTTILLVDDDPDICEILKIFLEQSGYAVFTAPGGRECIALLESHTPDFILLDIMMEPMDGWETLCAIQEKISARDIPVTIFSGKTPTLDEILHHGGFIMDYIMKPVNFGAISTAIDDIMERANRQTEEQKKLIALGHDPAKVKRRVYLTRKVYLLRSYTNLLSGSADQIEKEITDSVIELQALDSSLNIPVS